MSLFSRVHGFLEAAECDVKEVGRDQLIARQPGLGGRTDVTCVWVVSNEELARRPQELIESDLLDRFADATEEHVGARFHFVVPSTEGFSTEFRQLAGQAGVRMQPPAYFFDTPFRWEQARGAATILRALANEAEENEPHRVLQPFGKAGDEGPDIVDDILKDIQSAVRGTSPRLWVVSAPAGHGKSVMFGALFRKLFDIFQDRKKRQDEFPRPLPMLAEHLREAAGPNLKSLVNAFLQHEIAGQIPVSLFDWMINNRGAIWMLDGLDELITRDPGFIEDLEDRLTHPQAFPLIVICLRDSLLVSSEQLRSFIDYYGDAVDVINLLPWQRPEKRTYAWIRTQNRRPRPGENDPIEVVRTLDRLTASPEIDKITSTPFYAKTLLDIHSSNISNTGWNQFELLDAAVNNMCEREYRKEGVIAKNILPIDSFREWLEELAVESYESNGISPESLRSIAELGVLLAPDLSEEQEADLVEQLTMMPFLTQSSMSGRLEFTHEILGEYLAGSRFCYELKKNPKRLLSRLAVKELPRDSVVVHLLAEALESDPKALHETLKGSAPTGYRLRNLVQVLAYVSDGSNILKEASISLAGSDLNGVDFHKMDLTKACLIGSDLTNADLSETILQEAGLEGAVFRNTKLPGGTRDELKGARFRGGENFESVQISNGKRIDDYGRFLRWAQQATHTQALDTGPCPSARQLRHLFGKFVYPNGEHRRDELDSRGIRRGKQVAGAPPYSDLVDKAIEFKYLETRQFGRLGRPRGEKYGEIVRFMKNSKMSSGFEDLLDALCSTANCRHC